MRQVLLNSQGALVARMPAPTVQPGCVLVRTSYSLISVGTEISSLLPAPAAGGGDNGPSATLLRARAYGVKAGEAASLLARAVRHPDKAVRRIMRMVRARLASRPRHSAPLDGMEWQASHGGQLQIEGCGLSFRAENLASRVVSSALAVPSLHLIRVELSGHAESKLCVTLETGEGEIVARETLAAGPLDRALELEPGTAQTIRVSLSTAGETGPTFQLDRIAICLQPPPPPLTDMDQQGWNVGYSLVGRVVEVGSGINDLRPGQLVACTGAGRANHADMVSVPRNLACPVPEGCDPRAAASVAVGGIALQGVRRAGLQLGEQVCVIGLGLIGQIAAQLARAAGTRVIGFDLSEARVKRALDLNMDAGCSEAEALKRLIRDLTGGKGVDCVLVAAATKSDDPINLAMEIVRAKGKVVLLGDVGLAANRAPFYRKEVDLLMSTSYGPGRYDSGYEEQGRDYPYAYVRWTLNRNMSSYLDLIAQNRVQILPLIDRKMPVERAPDVYRDLVETNEERPLGVLFEYDEGADNDVAPSITLKGHRIIGSDQVACAMVGAGAFAQSMIVPQLARVSDRFAIKAVVSQDSTRGGNFARSLQAPVFSSDLGQILDDPEIQLVLIATRHDRHAEQAAAALRAGKHVFVEKPLALSWSELDTVIKAYQAPATPGLLMVDFNRRFSPALQAVAAELTGRRGPLMINYRLNGGYIPPEHWVQGREGGGRNIGEACHMYDVFRFLANAPVRLTSAMAIAPGSLPYFTNDNFTASIGFDDGSLGTLTYTALGPKQGLPKESIEIFADGECWVVNDFKSATRCSDGAVLWSGDTDKGHFNALKAMGDAILSGGQAPIPFEQLIEVTALSLRIEEQISGRNDDDRDD